MPHVLFVALSGVRIFDTELLSLGLTLPGFVERGRVIASMPSLGLLTLAGATPSHWTAAYEEAPDSIDEAFETIQNHQPDLVALSFLTARAKEAYALADRCRLAGIDVVLGGLHTSACPDEAQAHASSIVVGQGEWVWPQVLADWEKGALQPRYGELHTTEPLESTPLPRFDLLDLDRYNRIPIQTTRGCPLDCSFCAASRLISPYKRKSAARVREEVRAVTQRWPEPFIELADDNTFVNKAWGRELASVLGEFPGVHWFTETDVSLGNDPELVQHLASAGCAQVLVGLESISAESLAAGTDSGLWKKRQRDEYLRQIRTIQDHGISVNGCFVFGFDHDTPDTFAAIQDFIEESGLSEVQLTLLTPFPGTKLHRDMAAQGRLIDPLAYEKCTLFDINFQPKHFSPTDLRDHFAQMIASVYSEKATEHRRAIRTRIFRERAKHG